MDKKATSTLWYLRLGHPKDNMLHNLHSAFSLDSGHCGTCHYSKKHELPFTSCTHVSQELFELVHSHIWGPILVDSFDGFKYFIIFVDDKSGTAWFYLLQFKSDVLKVF